MASKYKCKIKPTIHFSREARLLDPTSPENSEIEECLSVGELIYKTPTGETVLLIKRSEDSFELILNEAFFQLPETIST